MCDSMSLHCYVLYCCERDTMLKVLHSISGKLSYVLNGLQKENRSTILWIEGEFQFLFLFPFKMSLDRGPSATNVAVTVKLIWHYWHRERKMINLACSLIKRNLQLSARRPMRNHNSSQRKHKKDYCFHFLTPRK